MGGWVLDLGGCCQPITVPGRSIFPRNNARSTVNWVGRIRLNSDRLRQRDVAAIEKAK